MPKVKRKKQKLPEVPKPPEVPVLTTEDLLNQFESQYNSFLGGFLAAADHGAKTAPSTPSAISGATLKSLAASTPRRLEIDFEGGSYRPSTRSRSSRPGTSRSLGKEAQGDPPGTAPGRSRHHAHHDESSRRGISGVKLAPVLGGAGGKDSAVDADAAADTKEDEELREREACESLRMLVLGAVGHEHLPDKDKPAFFAHLRRGTDQEVEHFCDLWRQLDADGSGDVDVDEFIAYFNKRRVDRLLGMRCVRWLMPKVQELGQEGVTKEDMLRLMWLHATEEDMEQMDVMFDYCRLRAVAMKPPKLLRKQRRAELLDIFHELDRDNKGSVPFADLIDIGIADHSMIALLRAKYDKNRDGFFDRREFLEMLAPLGYRAHPMVDKVVCKNGKRMRWVSWSKGEVHFEGWLLEDDYEALREDYGFPNPEEEDEVAAAASFHGAVPQDRPTTAAV